jgi:hypothetical protein
VNRNAGGERSSNTDLNSEIDAVGCCETNFARLAVALVSDPLRRVALALIVNEGVAARPLFSRFAEADYPIEHLPEAVAFAVTPWKTMRRSAST